MQFNFQVKGLNEAEKKRFKWERQYFTQEMKPI